jgi:hypothetical protein
LRNLTCLKGPLPPNGFPGFAVILLSFGMNSILEPFLPIQIPMGNGEGNFWMFIFDEEKVCCL